MFVYFVSGHYYDTNGSLRTFNCECIREQPIFDIKHIREIENQLTTKMQVQGIRVMNYIELRRGDLNELS